MESITLKDGEEYLGIDGQGLITIKTVSNSLSHYNPKYYSLVEQKTKVKETKDISPLQQELTLLSYVTKLKNKLELLDNQITKAKTTKDEDDFLVIGRHLTKTKEQINKYLESLKQSNIFSYKLSDNKVTLLLKGNNAHTKRVITLTNGITEGVNL